MANIILLEKVQGLRRQGVGINEIAMRLNVSKSTVSYWCKNISLTKSQISRLKEKQKTSGVRGLLIFFEKKRKQRLMNVRQLMSQGASDVGQIAKRELLLIGLALYWGEGYKRGNDEVGFTNSDSRIIKLIIRWFKVCYGINSKDFILRVSINELHKNRGKEVLEYWSKETDLPMSQFTKISFIKTKSKKIYSNLDEHFGTLRIKVRRGTNLKRRILGSLEALGNLGRIE